MTDLEKFQGRTRVFDGIKMASKVKYVVEEKCPLMF